MIKLVDHKKQHIKCQLNHSHQYNYCNFQLPKCSCQCNLIDSLIDSVCDLMYRFSNEMANLILLSQSGTNMTK